MAETSTRNLVTHPHIKVLNAVEYSAKHATFQIEDWRDAKVGMYIKACFSQDGKPNSERMWSLITDITDGVYTCVLNNDPVVVDMKCDDVIHLHAYEIMNIIAE